MAPSGAARHGVKAVGQRARLGRTSSSQVLHPLTRDQNKLAARSTGALELEEREVAAGCSCRICRSPRGAWRRESLEGEVECLLAAIRPPEEALSPERPPAPSEASSPSRSPQKPRRSQDASPVRSPQRPLRSQEASPARSPQRPLRSQEVPERQSEVEAAVLRTLAELMEREAGAEEPEGPDPLRRASSGKLRRRCALTSSSRPTAQEDATQPICTPERRRVSLHEAPGLPPPLTTPPRKGSRAGVGGVTPCSTSEGRRRPGSAPCSRPKSATPASDRKQKDAIARRLEYERDFVEKSRAAWEQKMATCERRCQQQALRRSSSLDKRRELLAVKAAAGERCQQWLPILGLVLVLQSLKELMVSGRVLRLLASLDGPLRQQLLQRLARQEKAVHGMVQPGASPSLSKGEQHFRPAQQLLLLRGALALAQPLPPGATTAAAAAAAATAHGGAAAGVRRLSIWRQSSLQHTAARSGQLALVRRIHGHEVANRLFRAAAVVRLFPNLGEAAVRGGVYVEGGVEWNGCVEEVQRAAGRWKGVKLKWGMLLYCAYAIAVFTRKHKRRASGRLVSSFLLTILIHNRLVVGCKHSLTCVKRIQRAVRDWVHRETTKRKSMEDLFRRCEASMLKKRWAEEDMALLAREKRLVQQHRGLKERKVHELLISITARNHQQYRRPKTPEDFEYIQRRLQEDRVPGVLTGLSIQHVEAARTALRNRLLRERKRRDQLFARELQTWHDIEQAVQMIDPSGGNPAPRPTPPEHPPLPMLKVSEVMRVVRKVSEWYLKNKEAFQDEISKMPRIQGKRRRSLKWWGNLAVIDESIRDIVHEVLQPECNPSEPAKK